MSFWTVLLYFVVATVTCFFIVSGMYAIIAFFTGRHTHAWSKWEDVTLTRRPDNYTLAGQRRHCVECNYKQVRDLG